MAETEPLTPADCDLRDFPFTPMFRARLFGSSFHARATDAEWRAGVTLWLKSWDQVPAGSLPDDDIDLCRLAELGRDQKTWLKIKDGAMRGWIKCTDGRLYHPVVAEGVLEAWDRRRKQSARGKAGASKKWRKNDATATPPTMQPPSKNDSASIPEPMLTPSQTNGTSIAQAMLSDSKGEGQGYRQGYRQGQGEGEGQQEPPSESSADFESDPLQIPKSLDRRRGTAWLHAGVAELPDDWRLFCLENRADLDPEATWARFTDYWLGTGKPMKDWGAVWRNWVRKERLEHGRKLGGSGGDSLVAAFLGKAT